MPEQKKKKEMVLMAMIVPSSQKNLYRRTEKCSNGNDVNNDAVSSVLW
jgi:hypothetical protein